MRIGFHLKLPLFMSDVNEALQIFEKCSNVKFHGNPSSGRRVVPSGRTDTTELIAVFRNFANAPKNVCFTSLLLLLAKYHFGDSIE
jgi:hypothetical protein